MEVIGNTAVVKLVFQTFLVLILGMIVWRVLVAYSKGKSQPKGSAYFDSKFKDKWKKKQ